MVRAAGVRHGECLCTEIAERRKPGFEIWADSRIPLHINAADLASSIIEVKVRRKLFILRAFNKFRRRSIWILRAKLISRILHLAEMLFDIRTGTKQTLL